MCVCVCVCVCVCARARACYIVDRVVEPSNSGSSCIVLLKVTLKVYFIRVVERILVLCNNKPRDVL